MPLGHTQDDAPGARGGPNCCLLPAGPTQKVQKRAPDVRKSSQWAASDLLFLLGRRSWIFVKDGGNLWPLLCFA